MTLKPLTIRWSICWFDKVSSPFPSSPPPPPSQSICRVWFERFPDSLSFYLIHWNCLRIGRWFKLDLFTWLSRPIGIQLSVKMFFTVLNCAFLYLNTISGLIWVFPIMLFFNNWIIINEIVAEWGFLVWEFESRCQNGKVIKWTLKTVAIFKMQLT